MAQGASAKMFRHKKVTGEVIDQLRRAWHGRVAGRSLAWLVLTAVVGGGGMLVIGATLASAELYDGVVEQDGVAELDRPVLQWIVERRTPALDTWVTRYTDLGSAPYLTPIVVAAALLLCWWWRRWTPALLLTIAAAGSVLMTVIGKDLADRVRPPQSLAVAPFETSPAFPSGHALNSWVLLILIAYLIAARTSSRVLTIGAPAVAVVLAAAMGLSRVYLGHHWLTDVMVGWTLGTAWLAVIFTGHRLALLVASARRSKARRPRDPTLGRQADRSSARTCGRGPGTRGQPLD